MAFESYHAHVYYDEATRAHATQVRSELARRFTVALGRWHDAPVGPHPQSMYQVAFAAEQFASVVPWLMANHGPLSVLIHPNTEDDLGDHSDRALWLGARLELKLDMFREAATSRTSSTPRA
jgi:aromatic ring-cleaving dioxygenase